MNASCLLDDTTPAQGRHRYGISYPLCHRRTSFGRAQTLFSAWPVPCITSGGPHTWHSRSRDVMRRNTARTGCKQSCTRCVARRQYIPAVGHDVLTKGRRNLLQETVRSAHVCIHLLCILYRVDSTELNTGGIMKTCRLDFQVWIDSNDQIDFLGLLRFTTSFSIYATLFNMESTPSTFACPIQVTGHYTLRRRSD